MSWGDPKILLESIFERIRLGKVKDLTLFSTIKLTEIDWVTLFHCINQSPTQIRSLQLSGHAIKGKAVVALQDFLLDTSSLESLAVFPQAAADEDLTSLFAFTRNPRCILTHLDLSNKSIHSSAPNLVKLLCNLPSLRQLNLSRNKGIRIPEFPNSLPLHSLDLSHCELTTASLLPWLSACPSLVTLNISHNPEIDDTLFESSPISLPSLSTFLTQNTGLSQSSFVSLLASFPAIAELDISNCQHWDWTSPILFSPTSITHLSMQGITSCSGFLKSDLSKFSNLQRLDISDCELQSSHVLDECLKHPSLLSLIFRNNSLIPFDLEVISSRSITCKRVDLTATKLTLRGLSVLLQVYPTVSTWEVSANPLCEDPEAVQELVEEYPEIQIFWR